MKTSSFQSLIRDFYQEHKRNLPWRPPFLPYKKDGTLDPYHIFVSEVMLQQTQVSRVVDKFPQFIDSFPSFEQLASASLTSVLQTWQGMGYNRRGKYLHESARIITKQYQNVIPQDPLELVKLPGIGPASAGSIIVFTFNKPLVFIETNIRRVMIHHYFENADQVNDSQIIPKIAQTIDHSNPRDWYYALMDYGSYLAKQIPNPNIRSKHYSKQSQFEGSNRQVRGAVLQSLLNQNFQTLSNLHTSLPFEDERISSALYDLIKEGMVLEKNGKFGIE